MPWTLEHYYEHTLLSTYIWYSYRKKANLNPRRNNKTHRRHGIHRPFQRIRRRVAAALRARLRARPLVPRAAEEQANQRQLSD